MKTICSVYEPGAHFEYYSQDVSVKTLNNIPESDTEQYTKVMKEMLEWLKQYIPDRVTVTYRRHFDEYTDRSEYLAEIEEAKKLILTDNGGKLPVLDEAQKTATELNVQLKAGQADDPEWREKVELEHQAIFRTKSLIPYLSDPDIIPTCPTLYDGLIATGSTKKSFAKFWAGVGSLERTGDGFNQLVITPKQLEKGTFDWEEVNVAGLTGKNFHKIRITQ